MGTWRRDYLDVILVPSGLLLMFVYHLILVYRYLHYPQYTVLGYEKHNKSAWVRGMFRDQVKDRGPAVTVMNGNISAATAMSSISLVLSALLGAWLGSTKGNLFNNGYIFGSRSMSVVYIKYASLLACFLLGFVCFVQTARHFLHALFLISMPDNDVNVDCVVKEVITGGNYWHAGLRSLYFAINLLMWIFGPIPMFLCSIIMVGILAVLDRNTTKFHDYRW